MLSPLGLALFAVFLVVSALFIAAMARHDNDGG
jgi:hypothetical protein